MCCAHHIGRTTTVVDNNVLCIQKVVGSCLHRAKAALAEYCVCTLCIHYTYSSTWDLYTCTYICTCSTLCWEYIVHVHVDWQGNRCGTCIYFQLVTVGMRMASSETRLGQAERSIKNGIRAPVYHGETLPHHTTTYATNNTIHLRLTTSAGH